MEAKENSMRWIVRDLGVFLYGCIFASRYLFFFFLRKTVRNAEKRSAKRTQIPVMVAQRRDLRIAYD